LKGHIRIRGGNKIEEAGYNQLFSSRQVSMHTVRKLSCTSGRTGMCKRQKETRGRGQTMTKDNTFSCSRERNGTPNRHNSAKSACDKVQEKRKVRGLKELHRSG